MLKRKFYQCLCLLAILVLSACKNAVIIESPSNQSRHAEVPDVKIMFAEQPSKETRILINNTEVTKRFEFAGLSAVADGEDLLDVVEPGRNTIEVDGTETVTSTFTLEDLGPIIHITAVSGTNPLSVSGYIENARGSEFVAINGLSIAVEGKQFSGVISRANLYEITAVNESGSDVVTYVGNSSTEVAPAIAARLSTESFGFLADAAAGVLDEMDFGPIIDEIEIPDVNGVSIDVLAISIDRPDIALAVESPINNSLSLDADVPNLIVDVELNSWLIGGKRKGRVTASLVLFDAVASVDNPNREISIVIDNVNAELEGFDVQVDGLPGWLVNALEGTAKKKITEALTTDLVETIQKKIEEAVDFVKETEFELAGARFKITPAIDVIDVQPDAINVEIAGNLSSVSKDKVPQTLGFYYPQGDVPVLGSTTPSGYRYDVGVTVSVGLINQALLAGYEGGLASQTLDEKDLSDLIYGKDSDPVDIVPGGNYRVTFVPISSPFVVGVNTGDNLGEFYWHDIEVILELEGASGFAVLHHVIMNARTHFDLDVLGTQIDVQLDERPKLDILNVISSTETSEDEIVDDFQEILPYALNAIVETVEGLPIPSVAGSTIDVKEIWVPDDNNAFFALAGNFVAVPEEAR